MTGIRRAAGRAGRLWAVPAVGWVRGFTWPPTGDAAASPGSSPWASTTTARSATPSSGASANWGSSGPSRPATTTASASTREPSTSPRSGSGYGTQFHGL